ncbi:conserved hypothetical protein [Acidithiobacillus ferrooxidans ATCC 23270]|jgi:hypothetical protein|uniref:Uncharacterized protein n=3 Tax=Acidithiobacillaceae TaxID=225058 RepID=B7J6P0_ACIF2|nr:conserved hypothetical protein [Acidithiobacillus ferrooxidans ATCC 23270]
MRAVVHVMEAIMQNVKTIGSNGQISFGKRYAGRQVCVEEQEPGVWLVRTVKIIPDNELWLNTPKAQSDLQRALAWASAHPADDTDTPHALDQMIRG